MTGQASFLQSLGWAVINSLWQLALLWVVYQALTAIFKKAKPAARSTLASSLLILGFAWFLFTFFSALSNGTKAPANIAYTDTIGINGWLQNALPVASGIYLVLLFIPLLRFIKNYRYVQVIRSYGLSKPAPEWRIFVNRIAARMGIRKPVHIWISEWVTSPVTIGFLKPIILVPLAAINHLSTRQMEAVLLHELAHIRRYDYLLNLVINFIRTILYFNPFAKAFIKIVEAEREKSCDDMVLQFQYDSHQYASALLSLEKLSREHQLLLLAAGGRRDLLHRVETILGIQQKQSFSFRRLSTVLTALVFILSINAILLFSKPIGTRVAVFSGTTAPSALLENDAAYTVSLKERPTDIRNAVQLPEKELPSKQVMPTAASLISSIRPDIINASFEVVPDVPKVELAKQEEDQVKEAIEASKKVIESEQWKSVEKNLADVFSQQEKESLKLALKDEIEKVDWNKWENKLRMAYDKVDWDNVNNQLYNALTRIKTDSLVKVYNEALVNINLAQRELNNLSLKGIPDSDISLRTLAEKQYLLQKAIVNLKANKTRKIVHL